VAAVTIAGNAIGISTHAHPGRKSPHVAVRFNSLSEAQRFNAALFAALRAVREAPDVEPEDRL
jgi:hypothetical protein